MAVAEFGKRLLSVPGYFLHLPTLLSARPIRTHRAASHLSRPPSARAIGPVSTTRPRHRCRTSGRVEVPRAGRRTPQTQEASSSVLVPSKARSPVCSVLVTTSKALVTRSDALVPSSF